jgi:hypothetical protein
MAVLLDIQEVAVLSSGVYLPLSTSWRFSKKAANPSRISLLAFINVIASKPNRRALFVLILT